MKRALGILALAAVAAVSATRPGRAQTAVLYVANAGDSVAAAPLGRVSAVSVRLVNSMCPPNYACSYAASQASFTVFYDPAVVEVVGVQAAAFGIDSSIGGGDSLRVDASGVAIGHENTIVKLQVRLLPGAATGAYLWIRPYTARWEDCFSGCGRYGSNAFGSVVSRISQVCHATAVWGDVDASQSADSRDALIVLSAAVGLPSPGFSLGMGDVDGDGLANSRDALMILSYAIGLSTSSATGLDRVGAGILPDVCPGLTAPGETVVYKHVGATAGIYRLDSLSITPAYLTGTKASDQLPRLAANDSAIVFRGQDTLQIYPQLFRMNGAGVGRRQLSPNAPPPRDLPDWSPDGTRIAYLKGGILFASDSAGQGEAQVGVSPVVATAVAWDRSGTALTYANSSAIYKITPVDSTGASTLVVSWPGVTPPLRWSPDGTTLLFATGAQLYTYSSGTGVLLAASFENGVQGFDWAPQGVLVSAQDRNGTPSLWLLQGGPAGPIVRVTAPASGEGDMQPSFRRNP